MWRVKHKYFPRQHGPTSDFYTVESERETLCNMRGRIKRFRRQERAQAAANCLNAQLAEQEGK